MKPFCSYCLKDVRPRKNGTVPKHKLNRSVYGKSKGEICPNSGAQVSTK